MSSAIGLQYGSTGVPITCTGASLASAGARASTSVSNTSGFEDALVQFTCTSGATGTVATGYVQILAIASSDGGTTWPEGANGTDGAVTLTVPTNAKVIGTLNVVANSILYKSDLFSVAYGFGGTLPSLWAIIIVNQSGHALAATATVLQYIGVQHYVA